MTAAAFRATYSDIRLIKGRKVMAVVFEVPLEQSSAVLDILGGMPDPSKSVWCAVARLQSEKEVVPPAKYQNGRPETPPRAEADNATRGAHKLTKRIAILCNDPVFQQFLVERYDATKSADGAAECVRDICRVASRKNIAGTDAEALWQPLYDDFQVWKIT